MSNEEKKTNNDRKTARMTQTEAIHKFIQYSHNLLINVLQQEIEHDKNIRMIRNDIEYYLDTISDIQEESGIEGVFKYYRAFFQEYQWDSSIVHAYNCILLALKIIEIIGKEYHIKRKKRIKS